MRGQNRTTTHVSAAGVVFIPLYSELSTSTVAAKLFRAQKRTTGEDAREHNNAGRRPKKQVLTAPETPHRLTPVQQLRRGDYTPEIYSFGAEDITATDEDIITTDLPFDVEECMTSNKTLFCLILAG